MKDSKPRSEVTGQLKETAVTILKNAKDTEREAMRIWLERLLQIRVGKGKAWNKTKEAISATKESKVLWPLLKLIAKEIRRHGWDERSKRTRWATAAAGVSIAVFGGQSAGIAALGGAIGVPLWVVFGGGAAFARILLDEIQRSRASNASASTGGNDHTGPTIDGTYIDVTPKD